MHEYDARQLANLYTSPNAAPLLQRALDDFKEFFQTAEQYGKAIGYLHTEFVVYARLCSLLGHTQAKTLLLNIVVYAWRAYTTDKSAALKVLAQTAADGDAANSTYWSLLKRYPQPLPWKNESLLLRDRVSELLTFASEYLEGVIKRELWPVLACRDIADRKTKDPLRWQSEKLGNIVSSASALPHPIGSFVGEEPIKGVTLNHFRNVGAHKDFVVTRNQIVLFPNTDKITATLLDLDDGLEKVGKIRMLLKLFNTIAALHDIEGLIACGYRPKDSPEAVIAGLATSLGSSGVYLQRVRRVNDDTEIECSTDREYTDEALYFTVLRHIVEFIHVYEDTFEHTSASRVHVLITKQDSEILQASCIVKEALEALNKTGNSEIFFEIAKNGIVGTAQLKVNVGDKHMPIG